MSRPPAVPLLCLALLVATPALAEECLRCHGPEAVDTAALAVSIHARLACADCHVGVVSEEHRAPLAPVACADCHAEVATAFAGSVHGQARLHGEMTAPGCTGCHGAHDIAPIADPASPVAPRNVPATCASCHEDERLTESFGLPGGRLRTYLESFHGVVNRFGEKRVANCASCHGVHDIRPSSDPGSSIHPDNLGRTCGRCHPGADTDLAGARMHVEAEPDSSPGMYYVRRFYTWFTGGLVVCFLAYITIEIYGATRRRFR